MRIALINERIGPAMGGREASTAGIAAALAQAGHDVTVICEGGAPPHPSVNVLAFGRRGATRRQRLASFTNIASQESLRGGYDVVHAMLPVAGINVYQPRSGTVPAQRDASLRQRGPLGRLLVSAVEPLHPSRSVLGPIESRLMADECVIPVAISHMVAQEFHDYYGRTNGVRVVPNAVGVPDASPQQRADWRQRIRFKLGMTPDDVMFLSVALNFRLKGVSEAIHAFSRWVHQKPSRRGSRLVVVGRDTAEGYQRQASMRDVGGQVVFVARTDEVFPWYSAADVCVLLSWYDPCSRTVLEATRWGVPSITTSCNGAGEVLAAGAGIVVGEPSDIAATAAAMEDMSDPARRAQRARKCLELTDSLGLERHVRGLLEVYAQVVARPAGGGR